ncbi:MAG: Gfo/Idh/MocA family oxidoreductase [Pseudomonadota bacterium]|nr:Gfo/Idh/MocA family oxidoreductase [Pseudomonadota bacterium]
MHNHKMIKPDRRQQPRVGLVGCGAWGRNLLRNLADAGVLHAVAETEPNLRQWISEHEPGLRCETDYQTLLDESVDAIAIATPAATHYRIARDALIAGKDVFVEKPLALSSAEGIELVDLARRLDRVLMVGHLLLHQPAIHWIKNFITEGRLGDVQNVRQFRLGMGRVRDVENVLWCLGSHDLAVQLFLLGEFPDSARFDGRRLTQDAIEDDVRLSLTYPGGVHAHLHTSWVSPVRRRQLDITGSRGTLVYDELAQTVRLTSAADDDQARDDRESPVLHRGHTQPLALELEEFLDCIRTRRSPTSDGQQAVRVIQMIELAMDRGNADFLAQVTANSPEHITADVED